MTGRGPKASPYLLRCDRMDFRNDEQQIHRFEELSDRAKRQYVFSGFLTLHEQAVLTSLHLHAVLWGGGTECERKMAAFGDKTELGYPPDFPIACICCKPKDRRFAEEYTHRDVLGAILGLGVKRECIGDIFVREKDAYILVEAHLLDFLTEHLTRLRHTDVICNMCTPDDEILKANLEPKEAVCASERADAVIAGAFHLSRSETSSLIEKGLTMRNGQEICSASESVSEGDILSVRGHGRFRLDRFGEQTASGRRHVYFSLYK